MKNGLFISLCLLFIVGCNKSEDSPLIPDKVNATILVQLATNYVQLPEKEIAHSLNYNTYAQYAMPTDKYEHGILGDKIEAEQLVVVVDSIFCEHKLSGDYVFEDIRPRLYDLDGDSTLEFITIRTNVHNGAGITIYKIVEEQLVEYAYLPEIGTSSRWLNVVTINDLDNDGVVELVWIETPHIGGILKVAKIEAGVLQVLSERAQYSNHAVGERNLCLSVLSQQLNAKVFYVPNQSRDTIQGFTFSNNELIDYEAIPHEVDFSKTLASQYNFSNILEDEDHCIAVKEQPYHRALVSFLDSLIAVSNRGTVALLRHEPMLSFARISDSI